MKRILLLLALSAVVVLLFAPAAAAEQHLSASPTATASPAAIATASPTATATASTLPRTGGPELTLPVTLVASLALIGFGWGALALVRRCSASL
jgi:hypothetical protein